MGRAFSPTRFLLPDMTCSFRARVCAKHWGFCMSTFHHRSLTGVTVFTASLLVSNGALGVETGEEVVVTATRLATPAERIGSSVAVISAADIERRQYRSVSDALQSVPSLGRRSQRRAASQAHPMCSKPRQRKPNHTLVLLDGHPNSTTPATPTA